MAGRLAGMAAAAPLLTIGAHGLASPPSSPGGARDSSRQEPSSGQMSTRDAVAASSLAKGVLVLAQLSGPEDARRQVAEGLAGALSPAPSVSASDGLAIGLAEDLEAAIAWSIDRLVPMRAGRLEDPHDLDSRPAPFAGDLPEALPHEALPHGDEVALLAIDFASVRTDGILQRMDPPHLFTVATAGPAVPAADAATRLALDVGEVSVPRALLFAAPAAVLPPVDEAHAVLRRGDEVLVFGQRDVCLAVHDGSSVTVPDTTGSGAQWPTDHASMACLRWLQLIVRSRGALRAGWTPAMWIAPPRGAAEPPGAEEAPTAGRLTLRPSHVERGHAHFVVLDLVQAGARGAVDASPSVGDLRVPARADGGFPRVSLERDDSAWVLRSPSGEVRTVQLDAALEPATIVGR